MYTPAFNKMSDEAEIRRFVTAAQSAQFVTVDHHGVPLATLLPIRWENDMVFAHMALANPQWKSLGPGSSALLICSGPEAYISPSWYAAKAEHGRVVPTWNYSAVHLTGTVRVVHDPEWLRDVVTRLTAMHEDGRVEPWQPSDAPEKFIEGQLGGIVGLEVTVTRVEGKAKLSQNRSEADRQGVIAGLVDETAIGARQIAEAMLRQTRKGPS